MSAYRVNVSVLVCFNLANDGKWCHWLRLIEALETRLLQQLRRRLYSDLLCAVTLAATTTVAVGKTSRKSLELTFKTRQTLASISYWRPIRLSPSLCKFQLNTTLLVLDTETIRCQTYLISATVYSVSQKNPPCVFLNFFPKRMGIFKSIFTHLLHFPFYSRLQIFIQLSPTLTKLCHTKRDQPTNFYISLDV